MAFNLFKKARPRKAEGEAGEDKKKRPSKKEDVTITEEKKEATPVLPIGSSSEAYRVLKSFYISEKASLLNGFNQYVFKVFRNANKSQIRKQVEKLFNVKVKNVKVLNMPRKRRDLGQHQGFRSEFKKAIVVLEKGQTIEQAKP